MRWMAVCLMACLMITRPTLAQDAPELVSNGGFENGGTDWSIYVPEDSAEKHCTFTVVKDQPHSGAACAQLNSSEIARFCVGHKPVVVTPGQHYRVWAWFRAGPQTPFAKKTPGFSIRLNLTGAHLQINAEGVITPGNPVALKNPMPTQWTQVAVVIEIPPGTTAMGVDLFSYAGGPLFIDDFSIVKVDSSVKVTPLEGGADYASLGGAAATGPTPPMLPAKPGPVVTDAEIMAELNLDLPGMEKVKAAIQRGQLPEIQQAYLDFRRHASQAQWKIMPSAKPANPTAPTDELGDLVASHHVTRGAYHYGPPATFMGDDFNWLYNPVARGDPAFSNEFTYCVVARTEFWQNLADAYWQTGNEKYAKAWTEQLQDFAVKNPMQTTTPDGVATVWRTLDSATRMDVSWPYCYYHFLDSPSFTPAAQWAYLKLMRDHADRLVQGLSNKARTGNWVTDECYGLYTIGALFPELKDAANWRDIAIDRLTIECNRTIEPDGMETELTPGYHFGALGQFRGPYELAQLNHLPIPDLFKAKIIAMYRAPVIVMQQNGQDVCTNDSWIVNARKAAKDGLQIGDDPTLQWAASGGKSGTPLPDSTFLPYAGFYTMRSGWDWDDLFLFFRTGPVGSGHEHQDKLEVTLRAWDNDLLIDPGTYTYDKSNFRRYFIGTAAHNTILVDGKWQHRTNEIPPLEKPVDNPWVTTPLFDFVAGTYDAGYQENVYAPIEYAPLKWVGALDKSVSHTRRVLYLRPYYVLVVDTLDGTGKHTFEAHYHIGITNGQPNANATGGRMDESTQAFFSDRGNDVNIALFPLEREHLSADWVQGQKAPVLGWCAKDNKPIPTPTVRFIKEQEAPAVFATFLYPYRQAGSPTVTSQALAAGEGLWARSIVTPREKMEVVLAKNGSSAPVAFASTVIGGNVKVAAAGLVLRQPAGMSDVYVGGWGLQSYDDTATAFTTNAPANLVFIHGTRPLFYNAGTEPIVLTLARPTAVKLTLAPQGWVSLDGNTVAAPSLFAPLIPKKK